MNETTLTELLKEMQALSSEIRYIVYVIDGLKRELDAFQSKVIHEMV